MILLTYDLCYIDKNNKIYCISILTQRTLKINSYHSRTGNSYEFDLRSAKSSKYGLVHEPWLYSRHHFICCCYCSHTTNNDFRSTMLVTFSTRCKSTSFLFNCQSHLPSSAFDNLHSTFNIRSIKIRHFCFCNFLDLCLSYLANFFFERRT